MTGREARLLKVGDRVRVVRTTPHYRSRVLRSMYSVPGGVRGIVAEVDAGRRSFVLIEVPDGVRWCYLRHPHVPADRARVLARDVELVEDRPNVPLDPPTD